MAIDRYVRRRRGPERAPGIPVHEIEGAGSIQNGQIGTTVLTGRFERGDPGVLTPLLTKKRGRAVFGELYEGLNGPHAVQGYFDTADNRGRLYGLRVTDGTEIKSSFTAYNRLTVPTPQMRFDARNGGRWAGKKRTMTATISGAPSGTVITFTGAAGDVSDLDTETDVWKGATVADNTSPFSAGAVVVSSTGNAGSPHSGTLTLSAETDMTDWDDTDSITITLDTGEKHLALEYHDASRYPLTHWRLRILLNGIPVKDYDNIGMDPAADDFYGTIVNGDTSNYYVTVTDLGTGTTAAHRPARGWSTSTTVAYNSATGQSTLTDTSLTGGSALVSNELERGYLYPNAGSSTLKETLFHYQIVSNTTNTITVWGDITAAGGANTTMGDSYRLASPQVLTGGFDGGTPTSADYTRIFSTVDSPINRFVSLGMNAGLVTISIPGCTDTTTLSSFAFYCEQKGYAGFVDCPENYRDEQSFWNWFNVEVGRSDNLFTVAPTFGYIKNPSGSDYIRISLAGDVLGALARVAGEAGGYHEPPAGTNVVIPRLEYFDFEWADFDIAAEFLCPDGINLFRYYDGDWIIWGARTLSDVTEWKWLHQRRQILHYEHVLAENLVNFIFKLQDPLVWAAVNGRIKSYFRLEYGKRALDRTKTFDVACTVETSDATTSEWDMEEGDLNALVELCLPKIIERLHLYIGKGKAKAIPARLDAAA